MHEAERSKDARNYFPICPICNFHAEMYFGTWQMCKHQREQEQLKEQH